MNCECIAMIEEDIKHMKVSDVHISVDAVSGEICIDEIELCDARGVKVDLIQDESGAMRLYTPGLNLETPWR